MTTELEKREKHEVTNTSAEQLIDASSAYAPDVDVFDTPDNLIMIMDLPGVKKGDVDIQIDENNTLTVKGKNTFNEPEKFRMREFGIGNYFRSFMLSAEFDKDKVKGVLENGVLEITIPRREEVKPKRIQISV